MARDAPLARDLAAGGEIGGESTTPFDRDDFRAEELVPVFDRVDFLVTRATITIVEERSSSKKKVNQVEINGGESNLALIPYYEGEMLRERFVEIDFLINSVKFLYILYIYK